MQKGNLIPNRFFKDDIHGPNVNEKATLLLKGLFTPNKSGSESESVKIKEQLKKDQRISDKHQRKLSLSLSLAMNGS